LDGTVTKDLAQYKGKVVYVDFWASWCGPCAQSFPFMNKMQGDLQAKGLEIVGVNLDEEPTEAKAFLEKTPAKFAVMADASGQCPQEFGVKAMPSSYLIDRKGVIRHVHLGFKPSEASQLREQVNSLLDEK
jgi:thiol-disulfide isomerase/thioredoxin